VDFSIRSNKLTSKKENNMEEKMTLNFDADEEYDNMLADMEWDIGLFEIAVELINGGTYEETRDSLVVAILNCLNGRLQSRMRIMHEAQEEQEEEPVAQ
jgi:hypothetical protein